MVTLLTVRGDTMEADLDVFRSLCLTGRAPRLCPLIFRSVDCVSDEHKGERNNDEAG